MKKLFKPAVIFLAIFGTFSGSSIALGCTAPASDSGCTAKGADWVCMDKTTISSDYSYQSVSCLCTGAATRVCVNTKSVSKSSLGETMTIMNGSVDTGSLNGFMQLALNITKWILGLSGSAALLMFVYGGFVFLISAGSSEKVSHAKGIIVGAVVGLLIVFGSYTAIGFVISAMGLSEGASGGWASSNWFAKKVPPTNTTTTDNEGGGGQEQSYTDCVANNCQGLTGESYSTCYNGCLGSYGTEEEQNKQANNNACSDNYVSCSGACSCNCTCAVGDFYCFDNQENCKSSCDSCKALCKSAYDSCIVN